MGCETVQGFIFAQPMLEQEYLDWVGNADRGARTHAA
jgi:EAL domain-containing protein (putative c-di-GMP-specific phosphodiesterase class I)